MGTSDYVSARCLQQVPRPHPGVAKVECVALLIFFGDVDNRDTLSSAWSWYSRVFLRLPFVFSRCCVVYVHMCAYVFVLPRASVYFIVLVREVLFSNFEMLRICFGSMCIPFTFLVKGINNKSF